MQLISTTKTILLLAGAAGVACSDDSFHIAHRLQ
jgi:hypothetical protein